MGLNQKMYPYNSHVKTMPVYLTSIGVTEWQYHVTRPEGYHWHQILYSEKGNGCLKYGKTGINLSDGWYFVLPAGCPHEYYPFQERWNVRWVAFDGFVAGQLLKSLGFDKPFAAKLGECSSLAKRFNRMFTVLKTDKVYGNYTCAGLIYDYIMEFYKITIDRAYSGGSDRSSLLMPVLDYIDENYMRDFPMTELADVAGITPQHLCRIFSEVMNMRPTEYLARRRVDEAKQLLTTTRIPIAGIAKRAGFSNAGYFSTIFKKYTGITPGEYRGGKNG